MPFDVEGDGDRLGDGALKGAAFLDRRVVFIIEIRGLNRVVSSPRENGLLFKRDFVVFLILEVAVVKVCVVMVVFTARTVEGALVSRQG